MPFSAFLDGLPPLVGFVVVNPSWRLFVKYLKEEFPLPVGKPANWYQGC